MQLAGTLFGTITKADGSYSIAYHMTCLLLTLAPAVYLTEQLGHIVEHTVKMANAPLGLVGVIVAVLVLAPEVMGAMHATMRNRLQSTL